MRMYVLSYNAVFTARVNQASFDYPIMEVDYDTVGVGPYTEILPGMTVLFGTTAGNDDLGRQRVKSADATTLYIGKSSNGTMDGEVNLADNAYITVLNDFRVWSKIPYITDDGTIYKDGNIGYTDETDEIPPKANGGPGMAGTISGGALEVEFDSAASYSPVGAAISTVLWDVKDGTITVGTLASAAITAVFAAGFRYVDLTVTDANGKSHTTHIPVYARDPDADTSIGKFQIERHAISKEGQQLSVRILEDLSEATYLDGTLVMIWEDEPADGADRSHMRFIGWHHTDPAQIRAERTGILRDTTFECLDIAGKLATLPGFPVSVEGDATPANWLEMLTPNMDKYIDYLLRWHSTALEVAHVTLSGTGSNYPFVILGSDAGSLWEQVRKRAEALVPDYLLTCNTKGQIAIKPDPMIQHTSERTATVQAALTEADWSDIRYTHQRPPRVHWLRSEAVMAHATEIYALFCVAPDNTPGQGTSEQTHGEQLAISQDGLNVAEGNRYGRLNATETYFSITLAEGSDQAIEPANVTWVTMVISAANAAQRGLTLATARGLVHQIDIRYSYGRTGMTKTVTLTWERETSGLPAITLIPPTTIIDLDYEPLPDPGYPDETPITAGDGFGTVYINSDSELMRTRDFSAASPSWVDVAPAALSGTIHDFILDPWQPILTGYLSTADGVYRSTDLDQASPSWSLILDEADARTATGAASYAGPYKIFGSINLDQYLAVIWQSGTGVYCSYTNDSRAASPAWSHVLIGTGVAIFGGLVYHGAADIVPHPNGGGSLTLYAAYSTGTYPNLAVTIKKSTDAGANWSTAGTISSGSANNAAFSLFCPYDNNAAGNIVYLTFYRDTSPGQGVYRSIDGGANWTQVYSGAYSDVCRWGVEAYTLDRLRMYFVIGGGLYLSDDGIDSYYAASMNGITGAIRATGGFPYDNAQFYAHTVDGIFVSIDRGTNWIDKTGDWTPTTTNGKNGAIVPVWVEE